MKLSEISGDATPAPAEKKLKLSDVQKAPAGDGGMMDTAKRIGAEAIRPIMETPGAIASDFKAGRETAREGIEQAEQGGAGNIAMGTGKAVLGGLQEVGSVFSGPVHAIYGDPVRRAIPGKVGEAIAQAGEMAIPMVLPGGIVAKSAQEVKSAATGLLAQARKAGYVFPPIMTKEAGPISASLESLGGKLKTRQEASIRNQQVKNEQGAQFIGLPKDTKLSEQVFTDTLAKEGKAYEAIKKLPIKVPIDDEALNSIVGLGGSRSAAAQEFKDLLQNPDIDALKDKLIQQTEYSPEALVEAVKQLRSWSRANFKGAVVTGDPGKRALAFAQKEAAGILDGMMERRLASAGYKDLVPAYRDARVKIAKIHDLESVTDRNGNVDSASVASLGDKKLLTDELAVMAATHQAFERAMGNEAKVGGVAPYSLFDLAGVFGAVGPTAYSGHPYAAAAELATIGARPLARKAALSERVQNSLARKSAPSEPTVLPALTRAAPSAGVVKALSQPQQEGDTGAPP